MAMHSPAVWKDGLLRCRSRITGRHISSRSLVRSRQRRRVVRDSRSCRIGLSRSIVLRRSHGRNCNRVLRRNHNRNIIRHRSRVRSHRCVLPLSRSLDRLHKRGPNRSIVLLLNRTRNRGPRLNPGKANRTARIGREFVRLTRNRREPLFFLISDSCPHTSADRTPAISISMPPKSG